MLMREVNHRVKNQYSVILSMIRETNKRAQTPADFEREVRERIMALSRSHDLLVMGDWKGVTVFELLLSQAKSFGNEERISMSGPSIILSPNAVQYLGIAFHELATNSAKYGVLSGDEGQISVTWNTRGSGASRVFHLTWAETDGPHVQTVGQGGFGTVVLKRVAPEAVGGRGNLQYGPHGSPGAWNPVGRRRDIAGERTVKDYQFRAVSGNAGEHLATDMRKHDWPGRLMLTR
ncbi:MULTISPECIES: sensor histidine kinase [unclassified Mesorhizobium]|uniref:sensor histidine kinase n=1 Tax=unclassified Mesorhizobium TaxID=325217 RepID=UPI00333B1E4F